MADVASTAAGHRFSIYFLYPLEGDVEGVETLFTPKLSQVEVLQRCATMSVDVT